MKNSGSTKICQETDDKLDRFMVAESSIGGSKDVRAYVVGRDEKIEIPEDMPKELKSLFSLMGGKREVVIFAFIVQHRRWSRKYWGCRFAMWKGRAPHGQRLLRCANEEEALAKAMRYYQSGTLGIDPIVQGMADRAKVEMLTRGPQ